MTTTDSTGTTDPTPDTAAGAHPAETSRRGMPPAGRIGVAVLGLTGFVALMIYAFAAPMLHSGPHELPLAVAGPEAARTQIVGSLEHASPGAFDITTYDSAADARTAVEHRDAIGAITAGPEGATVVTASGAGSPYAPLLTRIGQGMQAAGQKVTFTDVAPMTAADPTGASLTALALPLLFGGIGATMLLAQLFHHSLGMRTLGATGFALGAGFAAAAIMQFGFEAVQGNYLETALAISLGIAAISLPIIGMHSRFGMKGFAAIALTMLFLGNPLSGMATGPQWLPHPWGALGQLLPIGATGTVLRSAAFFDGHGMTHALVVLAVWILAGLALIALEWRRERAGKAAAA